jgi:hypothetical protein
VADGCDTSSKVMMMANDGDVVNYVVDITVMGLMSNVTKDAVK